MVIERGQVEQLRYHHKAVSWLMNDVETLLDEQRKLSTTKISTLFCSIMGTALSKFGYIVPGVDGQRLMQVYYKYWTFVNNQATSEAQSVQPGQYVQFINRYQSFVRQWRTLDTLGDTYNEAKKALVDSFVNEPANRDIILGVQGPEGQHVTLKSCETATALGRSRLGDSSDDGK